MDPVCRGVVALVPVPLNVLPEKLLLKESPGL
jgi:hypothetical protein